MVSAMRPSRRDSGMVDVTFDGPIGDGDDRHRPSSKRFER